MHTYTIPKYAVKDIKKKCVFFFFVEKEISRAPVLEFEQNSGEKKPNVSTSCLESFHSPAVMFAEAPSSKLTTT